MDTRKQPVSNFTYDSRVSALSFYVLGSNENETDANVMVKNKELFKSDLPISEGVYDAHMGSTDHMWRCETCGYTKTKCPGHAGGITLKYPVKSPLYRDTILKWLKVICFTCGNLVSDKVIKAAKPKILSEYVKVSRAITECTHCKAFHPNVIKDKYEQNTFYTEMPSGLFTKKEELFNHEIKDILNRITDETVLKLGKSLGSHPKKYILDVIRVAPNTIRPDIRRVGGSRSNNSGITALTKNIVEINELLPDEIPPRENIDKNLRELYFNLNMAYYELIKGTPVSGNQVRMVTNTNKAPSSIASRIPKKEGRVRRNLMGRRVRYMMRSVITGDNMLRLNEIGVPISRAKSIQLPETVREYNYDRLNTYYMNRNTAYPGCSGVIMKSTGKMHHIDYLDEGYQLQMGDIVLRDMIDGDIIGFNRQPSLLFSSISSLKVRVLERGETLRHNVSVCNLFNSDFDGDAMNAIIARCIQSLNEMRRLSSVGNWMISYKDSAPMMGVFQDALIGMAEFTRSDIFLDKYHTMLCLSQIDSLKESYNVNKKEYQSREIIGMFLPKINYPKKKAKLYKQQYAPFFKYKPEDIEVEIQRGQLVSGILDKNTLGQGVMGSILHIINNEYGYEQALDAIYNIQQVACNFFYNRGFTAGLRDINISDKSTRDIKEKIAAMMLESKKITERLNKNKLIAPIGITLYEHYESEQLNALEPGDDFVEPILNDIDFDTNGIARLVFAGSKGKEANVIAINGAIGTQTIDGQRMAKNFGWGRTSPYFLRYDTSPTSMGYIQNSFREGITSDIFPFIASEARHGLINIALSTSITGHQNRLSIKNLESILVDNMYKSTKGQNMVQPLYVESGLDPRRTEKVKFKTIMLSNAEMNVYKTKLSDLNSIYRNKNVQTALDAEYEQLLADRKLYRDIFFSVESGSMGGVLIGDTHQMPVNVYRIIEDVIYNFGDDIKKLPKSRQILDPIKTITKVRDLCDAIPYMYYNETQEKNKMPLPKYIVAATTLVCILIRGDLCTANLLKKNITDALLDIIITKIRITFKKALIAYGSAVGIIAAQCISEPMTQYMLDSKHRSGASAGGSKTNTMVRIQEILGAKDTSKMKNPSMYLVVKEEYEGIKSKVQEIANHIEMMNLNRFVLSTHIFFEDYGKPVHSQFIQEAKMIKDFEKYNLGMSVPSDITKWCIRYTLNKEEMILNSMKLETIITRLRIVYPHVFFVYTPENANTIIIRCCLRRGVVSKSENLTETYVIDFMKSMRETVIRGISGITATEVVNKTKSFVDTDGSVQTKMTYAIFVMGTNTEEILNNKYIDRYKSQTDSIVEFEQTFGIEAARNKIIVEMRKEMPDISVPHASIYADEQSFSSHITSIHRTGLQKREMSNVTLRLSFQSPIQVIQNAAEDGLIDKIGGISGPLILGRSPNIGSTYNAIVLNESFIQNHGKQFSKQIDDEL